MSHPPRVPLASQGSTTSEESLEDDRDVYAELLILHPAKCSDFELVRPVGHGTQGSVFAVRCTLEGLPPNKLYALKVFYHDKFVGCNPGAAGATLGEASDAEASRGFDDFRVARQNEWRTLSSALRHQNIIRIWTCFEDNITKQLWEELPESARSTIESSSVARGGRLAQFVVFDHHEQSVADYLKNRKVGNAPLPYAQAKKWALQLLDVACFLNKKHVVHSDLKLEHLLLTSNHDIVVTGFSQAKHFKEHYFLPYRRNETNLTDNMAHLSPEIHNQVCKLEHEESKEAPLIDYGHQTCWAIGVLIYECLMHSHPLPGYPEQYIDEATGLIEYTVEEAVSKPLPAQYTTEFNSLLLSLLDADPQKRLDVIDAKKRLHALHDGSVHYQLTRCEAALAEEKERTAALGKECQQLKLMKDNLLQHRKGIIEERNELRRQLDEAKGTAADLQESNTRIQALLQEFQDNPLDQRVKEAYAREEELKERWMSLNREKDQVVDDLDVMTNDMRQLQHEKDAILGECEKLELHLKSSEAARAQQEQEIDALNCRFGELYQRERKSSNDIRAARDGHLLTMKELEVAQNRNKQLENSIASLEALLGSTREQLQEREMEVIRLRGSSNQALTIPTAYSTVPPSGISTTAASTYGTQLSSPVASDAGSGFVRGPVPGPGSTPSVVIPASTGTAIGVVAGSGGGVGGMSYQVAMEKASSSLTSESDGVQPGIGDSKRSANTTGLIAEVKKGSFVAQQSVTSSTGTPVTPPTVFVPTDPLASGLQSADPAPGRHKKPIPCLTEGCEFYGRHDTQFYCSKCSSQRWAATLPAVRARTEPHRLQPTETEGDMPRRRLDFQANTETGGGAPNGSGSEVKAQCKEPNCTNPASEEFSGYCSFGCVIEMSKKESDLEARERELFATLNSPHATISAGNAESQQVMPQRSQSMVMPLESVDRRFCRSMGCSQPAKAEFNGFCFYCYQSKTTAPFYNEGAERCLNSYCVRVGEQAYGGLCRECFVRASS